MLWSEGSLEALNHLFHAGAGARGAEPTGNTAGAGTRGTRARISGYFRIGPVLGIPSWILHVAWVNGVTVGLLRGRSVVESRSVHFA
jgi:hypothetical protein